LLVAVARAEILAALEPSLVAEAVVGVLLFVGFQRPPFPAQLLLLVGQQVARHLLVLLRLRQVVAQAAQVLRLLQTIT
jgi:hypothetical protein